VYNSGSYFRTKSRWLLAWNVMEIRNTLYTSILSTLLLFERAENFFSFSSPPPSAPYTFLHLIFVRFFFLFSTFGFSSRALISYSRRCLQVQLLWRNFGVWRRENGTGRVRIHVDTGKNGGPPLTFSDVRETKRLSSSQEQYNLKTVFIILYFCITFLKF